MNFLNCDSIYDSINHKLTQEMSQNIIGLAKRRLGKIFNKGADDFSFFYSANFGGGDYCLFFFSKPKKLESEVSLSFWFLVYLEL